MTTTENSRAMAEAAIREIDPGLHTADRLLVEAGVWESFGFYTEANAARVRSADARADSRIDSVAQEKLIQAITNEVAEAVIERLAIALARYSGLLPGGPS
jgi:hypothetical protein